MGPVNVHREVAKGLWHGHKTVGTTKAQLTTVSVTAVKGVLLRTPGDNDPTPNTACVWVGGLGVTADSTAATGGLPIAPGESVTIPIDDPSKLYVISTTGSQDIAYFLLTE